MDMGTTCKLCPDGIQTLLAGRRQGQPLVVPLATKALAAPLCFHQNAALSTVFSCPDGLQHPKETEDPGFKLECEEATLTGASV